MLSKPIPLLDYSPDADPRTPGVFLDMDNFVSTTKGLKTLPAAVAIGGPPPELPNGTLAAELSNGFLLLVCGTAKHLYRRSGTGWTVFDTLPAGQTFHGGSNHWSFTTFGMDIIAVNGVDPPQISRSAQPFRPIASLVAADQAPPISIIAEATDFSIFLVPANQDTFSWYASSSDLIWKPDVATLTAAAPEKATPGPVTALHRVRGGAALFKEHSLYFGQFQGPPFVWQFVSVSETVGTPNNNAVVNDGDVLYFWGGDDFYRFDGASLTPIPNNLKEWFQAHADPDELLHMHSRYDPIDRICYWHFSSLGNPHPDTMDLWVAFATRTQKWTKGNGVLDENGTRMPVIDMMHTTVTLREQGTTYGDDTIRPSFETRFKTYGDARMNGIVYGDESFNGSSRGSATAVIGPDGALRTFTGPSPGGFLRTGEISDPPYVLLLSQVRPVFSVWPEKAHDPDQSTRVTPQASLNAVRQRSSGEPIPDDRPFPFPTQMTPTAFLSQDGAFNLLQTARVHFLTMQFTAFTEITAVQYDLTRMGTQ